MSDCLTQNISNNSNESTEKSVVKSAMDSVPQQSEQTRQQSPTTQLLISQQMSPIVTSIDVSNQNSTNDSSTNSSVSVSVNPTVVSSNCSEPQNSMSMCSTPNLTVTSSAPSVSTSMSAQGSVQPTNTQSHQIIVSSQPQLAPTSQTAHINANGLISHQPLNATITSVANQTMQMAAQTAQHNQMQPLLQTSVQPTAPNQMSVTMSQLPQVQVIQGAGGGTYQLQQVYPQGMLLPGNITLQNMNFQNQGLSLQIPFSSTGGMTTGTMPITSIAAKTPIMSKGVAISPLNHSQHHMISSLKPNLGPQTTQQILKQVLPQQYMPHSNTNQTVVISQLLPQQNQQSILPSNANKSLLEAQKGKQFGTASFRSAFGNKMLSHSAAIQPKSPILPATSISSPLLANSQFKSPFPAGANTQLITTQNPNNLLTNPQILGSFQTIGPGLTWATNPQSTHFVTPNGSPIFIRGPAQGSEHMFISTSNMNSPQIQAMSMSGPINVQNSVHTPIQVSSAPTQSTIAPTPLQSTSLQTMSVTSNINTMTASTPVSANQSVGPVTSAPTANKAKNLRQISSVATQTASPASIQKVESTTNLKPIAPAKPKPSAQQLTHNNKQNAKDLNSTQMRSTGVGTTQTVNQSAVVSAQVRPTTNKSDASNQTNKVSVATETPKINSQVSSSRTISDQNKQISVKNNTNSESSESKSNSVSEPMKTPPKRAVVEKKDASTEQDMDLTTNLFAQNSHKLVQNSVQTHLLPNSGSQTNGQIPVLSDLNRQDLSKQPQKAIVKPQKSQILTHVIDGYIIKESANPFPVNGLSFGSETKILSEEKTSNNSIESLKSKNKNENSLNSSASSSKKPNSERHLCLNCGSKRKSNSKNNRTLKRFCSQICSEKFTQKSANSSRLVLHNSVTGHLEEDDLQRGQELVVEPNIDLQKQSNEERKKSKASKKSCENPMDSMGNGIKNGELNIISEPNPQKAVPTASVGSVSSVPSNAGVIEESNNSAIAGLYIPPGGRNPLQWTVNDVYEFVRNLQGCTEYADEFRSQEIDGQALMLIKEDHLMNTMNMKLGPALKICSKINALREDVQKQS